MGAGPGAFDGNRMAERKGVDRLQVSIGGIPIVEHWLITRPTLMKPPLVPRPTLFIKPGTFDEVAFQLRTQALRLTFEKAIEEEGLFQDP